MLKRFRRETVIAIGVHFQCVSSVGINSIQCANSSEEEPRIRAGEICKLQPYTQAKSAYFGKNVHTNGTFCLALRSDSFFLGILSSHVRFGCTLVGGYTDAIRGPDTEPVSTGVDPNFVIWGLKYAAGLRCQPTKGSESPPRGLGPMAS
jgi:hypothetical protein